MAFQEFMIVLACVTFAALAVGALVTDQSQPQRRTVPIRPAPATPYAVPVPAPTPPPWPTKVTPLDSDWLLDVPMTYQRLVSVPVVSDIDPAAVIARLRRTVPVRPLTLPAPRAVGLIRMHSLPSVAEYLAMTA